MTKRGTEIELARLSAIVHEKTGEFFCMTGSHYAHGNISYRRGRKQCDACKKKFTKPKYKTGTRK